MLTRGSLLQGFARVPMKAGDTVMVHTSYRSLGGVEGGADTVIDVLRELVGSSGTLLFPTFNFQSWTESHYFDILETPSKMGMITELARLRPESMRTPHPIYSFAVIGARAAEFAAAEDREAYGPDSSFAHFHRGNGTILSIGLDFNNTFSMHHYVEYNAGCDYRRVKEFSGIYVGYDREPQVKTYSMFVRRNERVRTYIVPGMNELLEAGVIKEIQLGEAKVHSAGAVEFFEKMSVIIREHPEKLHSVDEPEF